MLWSTYNLPVYQKPHNILIQKSAILKLGIKESQNNCCANWSLSWRYL